MEMLCCRVVMGIRPVKILIFDPYFAFAIIFVKVWFGHLAGRGAVRTSDMPGGECREGCMPESWRGKRPRPCAM
jgi:hypothetical protein